MPSFPEFHGVEVTIRVDEEALFEFRDFEAGDSERTKTRYVISKPGQMFEIHIYTLKSAIHPGDGITFKVTVDGRFQQSVTVPKHETALGGWRVRISGMAVPDRMTNRFTFGAIMTAEASTYEPGEEDLLGDIGTITIEMYYCSIGRHMEEPLFPDLRHSNFPIVSQKALTKKKALPGKEGLNHAVELVDIEAQGDEHAALPPVLHTEQLDDAVHRAEFHYRPRGQSIALASSAVTVISTLADAIEAMLRNCDLIKLVPDELIGWQRQLRQITGTGQLKNNGALKRKRDHQSERS